MRSGRKIRRLALLALAVFAAKGSAQENSAKRLSSIVSVAVEEYGKAVDASGRLISADEYSETTGFLDDAKVVSQRLRGYNAPKTQAVLDTLISAVKAKRPPQELRLLHARFTGALGSEGALDLPSSPLDTAKGHALFTTNCSSCHGDRGLGDGPASKSLGAPVPAIGSPTATPTLNSTLAYNVVSVGVRGTAMASFASTLSTQDRWNVVNYIYSMRGTKMEQPAPADATAAPGSAAAHSVLALLDRVEAEARAASVVSDEPFDPGEFELREGGWDHEHCDVCWAKVVDGMAYWPNVDPDAGQVDLCEACYPRVIALLGVPQEA